MIQDKANQIFRVKKTFFSLPYLLLLLATLKLILLCLRHVCARATVGGLLSSSTCLPFAAAPPLSFTSDMLAVPGLRASPMSAPCTRHASLRRL